MSLSKPSNPVAAARSIHRLLVLLAALALCALSTSCEARMATAGPRHDEPTPHVTASANDTASGDAVLDDAVLAQARGNNAFAVDLYQQLAGEDATGNLFFSPYSISTALAMTYAGARGNTADEMRDTLHLHGEPTGDVHDTFGALQRSLQVGDDAPYALAIANRLFGEQSSAFHQDFIDRLDAAYGAPLEQVDFRGDADGVRQHINGWVEDQTEDRIKDLIKPGILDGDTRLVLTNAIYFKGDWASRFDAGATSDQPFLTAAGESVEVPLMVQNSELRHGRHGDIELLELPYQGDRLSMLVMLPPEGGLAELEKQLDADTIAGWAHELYRGEITAYLPRFEMTQSVELNQQLAELGMPTAFAKSADFTGMTDEKPLFIDKVIHKAFVKVDEKGTEAAAATAVVMATESAAEPKTFRADRAFLFAIRDTATGSILFMGRVADPRPAS